jgi:hypothetical protein
MSYKITNVTLITISVKMRKERKLENINTLMTCGHKEQKQCYAHERLHSFVCCQK